MVFTSDDATEFTWNVTATVTKEGFEYRRRRDDVRGKPVRDYDGTRFTQRGSISFIVPSPPGGRLDGALIVSIVRTGFAANADTTPATPATPTTPTVQTTMMLNLIDTNLKVLIA
jgi:hypothetical protein